MIFRSDFEKSEFCVINIIRLIDKFIFGNVEDVIDLLNIFVFMFFGFLFFKV